MTTGADNTSSRPDRRQFVQAAAGVAGAAGLATAGSLFAQEQGQQPSRGPWGSSFIDRGATVLFQGDSITDAGRDRNDKKPNSQKAMGDGYAWLAAAQMLVDRADDDLKIFNRGVSGNKVYQMDERWQEDCLDLKPNVLSILIGVNDFWHKHKHGYDGTVEVYEKDYHALLKRTKEALPEIKLIVCEPFVLKVGEVDDTWFPEFDSYRAAARRVADEAGAVFVPFQSMFDEAVKVAPAAYWAADGVHPSAGGSTLMAYWWMRSVRRAGRRRRGGPG
jgi:lysophospholipase L1-like esterase